MSTTWTLWLWSVRNDDWDYVTESTDERKRKTLSTAKKRHPADSRFKWTTGYKPKRFRQRHGVRSESETDMVDGQGTYICPFGCGKRSKYPLKGHAAECEMNPDNRGRKKR